MAESSAAAGPEGIPTSRALRDVIAKHKREYIDAAMDKGESWTTKVINGEIGIKLDDVPRFLSVIGKKIVSKEKVCVDPETARAQDVLFRKFAVNHSLLFEDAE